MTIVKSICFPILMRFFPGFLGELALRWLYTAKPYVLYEAYYGATPIHCIAPTRCIEANQKNKINLSFRRHSAAISALPCIPRCSLSLWLSATNSTNHFSIGNKYIWQFETNIFCNLIEIHMSIRCHFWLALHSPVQPVTLVIRHQLHK